MSENLNTALIEAIHTHVPEDANPALMLADTLNIGREAAYRRLRGEVPFTFNEAAELGAKLQFSLDRLVGPPDGSVLFNLKFTDFKQPLDVYAAILEQDIRFFGEIAPDPSALLAMASNALPAGLYLRYDGLADFKLFKWLYQHGLCSPSQRTFEDLCIPQSLRRLARDYAAGTQMIDTTYFIFDDSNFRHWLNAVQAFRAMHLISDASVHMLREELFCLLDDMEEIAVDGEYPNGNKLSLYLSDIDIEASYSYVATDKHRAVGIGIFSLNALRTTDERMFHYVKRWVQTQSRFATLISRSGEMQRIRYFKQQREIIGSLR